MAEEQKNKPKATLIKHRKPDPKPADAAEKTTKKVVVVRKKPKADKKTAKVVAIKETKTPEKMEVAAPKKETKKVVAEVAPEKVVPAAVVAKPEEQPKKKSVAPVEAAPESAPKKAEAPKAAAPKAPVSSETAPKSAPKAAAPKVDSKVAGTVEKPTPEAEKKTEPPKKKITTSWDPRTGYTGVSTREKNFEVNPVRQSRAPRPAPRQNDSQGYRRPNEGGANRFSNQGRPRPQGDGQQRYNSRPNPDGRPATGTPARSFRSRPGTGPGTGPGMGSRPSGPGRPGQRPGQRPGPGRPSGPNRFQGRPRPQGGGPSSGSNTPETDNKPAGKKFKAKKKTTFQKGKREQDLEKDFQIKKKSAQKANPIPKQIDIMEVITVSDLARKMNLKASEIISKLMSMGMMVTINQQIDAETATIVAEEYGCKVCIVSLYDETIIESEADGDEELKLRPPIVTVMGHVDHGKTKLLDAIRSTEVAEREFGGITQHIGAYKVTLPNEREIVFLDTPGHEAFTLMRARGAEVTDIVILVVAADDGLMPQTREAINHAKEAKVPIIVAINKIDLPGANPDRVRQQLAEYDLMPESWGGTTLFNEISALKQIGIEELLDNILLQADMMELKANYNCRAEGKVIESKVEHGRGIVSTVIIERGTLQIGDAFIAGVFPGKVRAMFNDKGIKIDSAPPSTPVEVLGFTGVPNAGAPFQVTENEKLARQVGSKRQELEKHGESVNVKKITLDNLYESIQDGEIQELKVIIKGDVHGSVEALQNALEKLSTSEIRLVPISASAGAIVESDVHLAMTSSAIIVGFHVRPTPKAQQIADREKVEIRKYNVIYDAVEDIKSAMEGLLAPDLKEEVIGEIEVRNTFKVPKIGTIAGCFVKSGKIMRNSSIRVFRDGVAIHTGKISSLKRFKDDAREVASGYECGIGIDNYTDLQEGDMFEAYEIREVAKKL